MIQGNHYKYINPEYINEMADGDDEFIKQIIDIYASTIPENMHRLVAASEGDDFDTIIFATHSFRGSMNFIGGIQLIHVLDKIDELCHSHTDLPGIRDLVREVAQIAEEIKAEFQEIAGEVKNSGVDS